MLSFYSVFPCKGRTKVRIIHLLLDNSFETFIYLLLIDVSEYLFQRTIMHIYENTHKYMGEKGNDFSLNKGKKIKMSFSFNDCGLKMSKFEVMHFQHRLCENSFTY